MNPDERESETVDARADDARADASTNVDAPASAPAVRKRRVQPYWYTVLTMMLSALLFSGVALFLALYANAESDRKWCSVVDTLDDAWHEAPPTSPSGRNLAHDISDLRASLRCPLRPR